MTITYPRTMPASGPSAQEFAIQRVDFSSPEASGRVGSVQAGFPLWTAIWTLARLSPAASDEWTAWIDSLRGSQRRFLSRDFSRPYPLAHIEGFAGMSRAGGGAFDGAALAWSQAITAEGDARLTLTGLPAGMKLSLRDYVGIKWDASGLSTGTYNRRTLARVTEAGTASGGGSVTVTVEPPIPPWIGGGAIAHLDHPACVMTLLPEGVKFSAMDRRRTIAGTSIAAVQDLRP